MLWMYHHVTGLPFAGIVHMWASRCSFLSFLLRLLSPLKTFRELYQGVT